MGIKFRCPNGHKLNVKAFLAGKRGICPHCGAKVDIPLASAPKGGTGSDTVAGPLRPTPIAKSVPGVAPETVAVTSKADPVVPVRPAGASTTVSVSPSGPASAIPTARPASPVSGPAIPTAEAPGATSGVSVPAYPAPDPIAEAPGAVWYIRPASGGQFGPASGDIMRRWMAEGRVAANALVWREGWPDWQPAAGLFPQLAGPAAGIAPTAALGVAPAAGVAPTATVAARPATPASTTALPDAPDTVSALVRRRRRSNSLVLTMVIILTLASIGLLATLVVVVVSLQ